jgi:hypothetical protein
VQPSLGVEVLWIAVHGWIALCRVALRGKDGLLRDFVYEDFVCFVLRRLLRFLVCGVNLDCGLLLV